MLHYCLQILREMSNIPKYTDSERVADGCVHILSVSASVIAVGFLIYLSTSKLPTTSAISLIVYGVATVSVFSISAIYHLSTEPQWKDLLRRCDHAAIFMKIAGTYTPFALVKMGGAVGYGFLACVWCIAVFGAGIKVWRPREYENVSLLLYLALGWAALVVLDPLISSVSSDVLLLLGIGGVFYTVGVVFYLWERLPYHNAIWHSFVLIGAGVHYFAVVNAFTVI